MKVKVQLKTKTDLLLMGYENNCDPKDFLNYLAGNIVTLNLNKTIFSKCGGKIFCCEEYPDYAIYDYLIKRVIYSNKVIVQDEFTLQEIGNCFGISMQRVSQIVNSSILKLQSIVNQKNLIYENLTLE